MFSEANLGYKLLSNGEFFIFHFLKRITKYIIFLSVTEKKNLILNVGDLKNESNKTMLNRLASFEKYGFFILTISSLVILYFPSYMPTLDGPAHLYNATIIKTLVLEENSLLNDFYKMNHELVPNWSGHFILASLSVFFSGVVSEKIFLSIYLIGLPYAFRSFIKVVVPEQIEWSYFIFPFVLSSFFFLGFYNFNISLVILFYTFRFWFKNKGNLNQLQILQLFLLITFCYFSHVFIFGILIILIALFLAIDIFHNATKHKKIFHKNYNTWKPLLSFSISAFIPIILAAVYYFSRGTPSENEYLPLNILVQKLVKTNILYGLGEMEANKLIKLFFEILMLLTIYLVFIRIYVFFRKKVNKSSQHFFQKKDVWLLISIACLFLFFKSPDQNEFGGLIADRFILLFYLFLIIWLAQHQLNSSLRFICVGFLCMNHYLHLKNHLNSKYLSEARSHSEEIYKISKNLNPEGIVLPINYSENWLNYHVSNYLGVDNKRVVLENYESDKNYFPVMWNSKRLKTPSIKNHSLNEFPSLNWNHVKTNELIPVDYILILGKTPENVDSTSKKLHNLIHENYTKIYHSSRFQVFEKI